MTGRLPDQETGGTVVVHVCGDGLLADRHDAATREEAARRLAGLLGYAVGDVHDPARAYAGHLYFVPSDTLLATEARVLGISGAADLFGGVVPCPFVATKAITHPLVAPEADAPPGWSHGFARHMGGSVVAGFTVFSLADARRAALRLLEDGPLRLKPVRANAGRGQVPIAAAAELAPHLAALDEAELAQFGLVLEEDLTEVATCSVGRVEVGGLVSAYVGAQRLTSDNRGEQVYGGSDLLFVRGGFDVLLAEDLPQPVRLAVIQASQYDAAAFECFPGFFASRRNYDVAQGVNARGRRASGVLEQSWRIGGASGAEIAALEAFRVDPGRARVRAATVELYGEGHLPPAGATIYFDGVDPAVGPLLKYAVAEP